MLRRYGMFVLLALIALGLRLHLLVDMEWNYDEKIAYEMAGELLHCERLPLVGLNSSVGIPNPPGFVLAVALLRLLSSGPLGVAVWVAIVNAAAVVWLAWFLRPRAGDFVTWTASFLMATAPWAVIFSRKIWAQDLLAPFSIVLLIGTIWIIERVGTRAVWLMIMSAFALLQIHLSSPFIVIAVVLTVLVHEKVFSYRKSPTAWFAERFSSSERKAFLIAGGTAAFLFAPYILLLLKNLPHAIDSLHASKIPNYSIIDHLRASGIALLQTFSGVFFETTLGRDAAAFVAFRGHIMSQGARIGYALMTLCYAAGGAVAVRRWQKSPIYLYTLLFIAAHHLYILFLSTRTGVSYFVILYPLPFLLIAWGLTYRPLAKMQISLAVGFVCLNVLTTLQFQRFIHVHGGTFEGYGKPYCLQLQDIP